MYNDIHSYVFIFCGCVLGVHSYECECDMRCVYFMGTNEKGKLMRTVFLFFFFANMHLCVQLIDL